MTIQQWEDRTAVTLSTVQDVAVHRLGEWAQSADAAYQVAERLASSAFVPVQFKGKPVELTAAILSGLEVGLSPMAAMRAFDVIQGQAAARAITLRAIAQSHGHEMVVVESTSARCRMKGKRKGSDEWQHVTWDTARAQGLGLLSKDNWKKQPGAMLLARATSELARLIASDAILGIGYSVEEISDGGGEQTDTTTPAPSTGTRRMGRPKISDPDPVAATAAESTDQTPEVVEDEPSGSEPSFTPLTDAQLKKIGTCMSKLGITNRDEALVYVAVTIGREVESRNDLSKSEANTLINRLEDELAEGITDAEVVEP